MESLGLINLALLVGAAFVLLGIVSGLVATRFGAPLLFVFLLVGMAIGEDGPGGVVFEDYSLTYLVGSLALSIILFDGGLRTRLSSMRGALSPALMLATVGVLLTAFLTAFVAAAVLDLSTVEALLFGGMVASTDAAAVFFLLRSGGLRLQSRVGATLEMESGTNDPMAVLLTVLLTEWLLAGGGIGILDMVNLFLRQALMGAVFGVVGGLIAALALNRIAMPGGLHPLFAAAMAVTIFATTSVLGGSGFLAVYLAGLVLANRPVRAYPSILAFHEAVTWLAQIVMFLVLGLLVTPTTLLDYVLPGLAVALFLIFIARPVAVWLCLAPFGFGQGEKTFISWVGLRGAVSIFLATIPTLSGVPHAEAYFNVAFFVVMTSLLLQGATIKTAANRFGLALRRGAPSVRRIELDIPGQTEQELVGYPVMSDSMILGLSHQPSWAKLNMVVRDGEVLNPSEAGPLEPGDFAYYLVKGERVMRLDQLFVVSPATSRRLGPLFGELAVNGEAGVADICRLYGLPVVEEDEAPTVSDLFVLYLKGAPEVGQRIPLGRAWLVVRRVENGRVTKAGLQMEEMIGTLVTNMGSTYAISPLTRLWRGLRRRWRKLRER